MEFIESFKFTHEISDKSVSFLDTLVNIDNGKLKTDLYCKPTDSHNYLRYESAHPQRQHIHKYSIQYSQILRVRKICSDLDDFDRNIICLSAEFIRQGYPLDLLVDAAFKARDLDRDHLLSKTHAKSAKDVDDIFLISTGHPHDQSMWIMIHRNWDFWGKSQTNDFLHKKNI